MSIALPEELPLTPPKSKIGEAMLGQRAYDFYRCARCNRLCTLPEMMVAVGGPDSPGTGSACPCGGLKYSPVNLPLWGWLLPRVWVFAYRRLRGRA